MWMRYTATAHRDAVQCAYSYVELVHHPIVD